MAGPIEDPRPQYPGHVFGDYTQPAPFPIKMGQFQSNLPLRYNNNDRVNVIRDAGYISQNFYFYAVVVPTGFEFAVGVTSKSKSALDGFFR